MIYDCIRGYYNDLDREYSDNPKHYDLDMRMLVLTCDHAVGAQRNFK